MHKFCIIISLGCLFGSQITAQASARAPTMSLALQVAKADIVIDGMTASFEKGAAGEFQIGPRKYHGSLDMVRFNVEFVLKGQVALGEIVVEVLVQDPRIESDCPALAIIAPKQRCLLCLRKDNLQYKLVEPFAKTVELPQEIDEYPAVKADTQALLQWELLNAIRNGSPKVVRGALEAAPGALVKDEQSVELLTRVSQGNDPELVLRALIVLISFGQAEALDKAVAFGESGQSSELKTYLLGLAVLEARSVDMVPSLKKLLNSADLPLRECARYALGQIARQSKAKGTAKGTHGD